MEKSDKEVLHLLLEKLTTMEERMDKLASSKEGIIPNRIYSSEEVCKHLKVGETTLKLYRYNNKIEFSQYGNKIWYMGWAIMNFINDKNHKVVAV